MNSSNYVNDILAQAARRPGKAALVQGDRRIAYGDLPAELARLAGALRVSGIGPGMRVGLVTRDPVENLLVETAVAGLGAVACSMDPATTGGRRQEIARLYGFDGLLESADCASGGEGTIPMDAAWLAAGGPPAADFRPVEPVAAAAVMSTTSGTTGTPTGVIWGHGWARSFARLLRDEGIFGEDMVWLGHIPHFIFAGSVSRNVLLLGGTVVMAPGLAGVDGLVDAVRTLGITHVMVPPVLLGPLVGIARQKGAGPLFPDLRWLMVGGDSSDAALLRQAAEWLTPDVLFAYGSTTAGVATVLRAPEFAGHEGSAGRAIGGVTVEIVDRDDRPLPPDAVGAIRVRGELTYEEVIGPRKIGGEELRDGYQYTGDVGRLDGDGHLHVLGRLADVIDRNGVRVLPGPVEVCLRACPGVREVTVAGVPHAADGQAPIAFVVAEPGTDPAAIAAFARARLPEVERPADIVLIDATPRNHLGKALRRDLVARYLEGS